MNRVEHKPTWLNQDPKIFTAKVMQAEQAVGDLEQFAAQQGQNITGRALIAAYQASRIVRDLGSGSNAAPTSPAPTS